MKIISLLLSLCLASVALADDPAELVKLRATYDNSLRSDFQKVGKLYHGRLVELKKSYMEAQNLEGAVAVDAEIKKLRETHGKIVVKVAEAEEEVSPLDGVWIERVVGGGTHVKIIKEGEMIDSALSKGKLTITKDILMIDRLDGFGWKLKIDPKNPNIMKGANIKGKKVVFERYKW